MGNNKILAKNTLILYSRTFISMMITIYTSRVILQSLGIIDYGIYNVVGGIVMMFNSVSGTISLAISRYFAIAIGKNDYVLLNKSFSTSINIQILLSILMFVIIEIAGISFLDNCINIPIGKLASAHIVLQLSILSFIIGLLSIPYNALLIAYEKMNAFAYISIFETICKLMIAYILFLIGNNRLVVYSLLLMILSIMVRLLYSRYCMKHFTDITYRCMLDKNLTKEIFQMSSWNLVSNSTFVLNTQGISLLINVFWGVVANAARGLAVQIESAVIRFVNDFTTALNPQIIKCYGSGEYIRMHNLICIGAKISYYLLLIIAVPIFVEIDYILSLWLVEVPQYTSLLFRLSIISTALNVLGNTSYIGCIASGKMKFYVKYTIGFVGVVFPFTFLAFFLHGTIIWAYIPSITINLILLLCKLRILKELINFPIWTYFEDVIFPIIPITFIAFFVPFMLQFLLDASVCRLVLVVVISILNSALVIYVLGLKSTEKQKARNYLKELINKLK